MVGKHHHIIFSVSMEIDMKNILVYSPYTHHHIIFSVSMEIDIKHFWTNFHGVKCRVCGS